MPVAVALTRSDRHGSNGVMQYVFYALFFSTLIFAFWRGGEPERLVALIYVFAEIGTDLSSNGSFVGVELGIFGIDVLILAALILVILRHDRRWLIWTSALQLVTVAAHLARFTGGSPDTYGYAWVVSALAYPMLILLAVATWKHSRAAHAIGT